MPTLSIPNTFTAFTKIQSSQVNANFTAIATLLNTTKLDADNIQALAITSGLIAASAVTTAKINDLAVTAGKIAANTITKAQLDTTTTRDSRGLENWGLTASVATNALTVSLVSAAGTACSATDYASISFRSSTATSGVPVVRTVTGALSVVVSEGSTLGHASGVNQYIYVYALDNAGAVELAVSGQPVFDESSLQTTVAEGGAGGADSGYSLYSTTQRTDKAVRFLGRLKSNQAAAGTWATAISEISLLSKLSKPRSMIRASTGAGYGSTNNKIRRIETTVESVGSAITQTNSAANGTSFTINETGVYSISYSDSRTDSNMNLGISKNSTELTTSIASITNADVLMHVRSANTDFPGCASWTGVLRAGDVIRPHTDGGTGSTSANFTLIVITKISD